jgi:hypothetical protein
MANRLHRCSGLVAAVAAVALLPAAAQGQLEVKVNEATYVFAESMTFNLEAVSPSPITDVVLRYTVGRDGPRNRRIPEFTPGTQVKATHKEDLVRGQIPPASQITWWWTLTDATGQSFETKPESIIYLDRKFDWQTIDGQDIRVWYYGDNRAIATETAANARQAVAKISQEIGAGPKRRIEIVVYASRDDMQPALVAHGDVYESRLTTLGARVAPDILLMLATNDERERAQVLAHELTHTVLHLYFGREYIDAPMWLDEGLAMYSEGPLNPDDQSTLDTAIREDRLLSVRSLASFPGQADLVPLAYDESRDVVAFLIETKGRDRFQRLLDLIGNGKLTIDQALQQAYGYDQLSLYQAYRQARGLPPAATPMAGETRPVSRAPAAPSSGICSSAALLLPVLAVWWRRGRQGRIAPGVGV